MNESDFVEKIALYFYFLFLDEAKAQVATTRAIRDLRRRRLGNNFKSNEFDAAALIGTTDEVTRRGNKISMSGVRSFSVANIVLPPNSNWGPWFDFKKQAAEKDFQAIIYNKILTFSESDIAKGLKVPLGTVRYRISSGLKTLGKICDPESKNA